MIGAKDELPHPSILGTSASACGNGSPSMLRPSPATSSSKFVSSFSPSKHLGRSSSVPTDRPPTALTLGSPLEGDASSAAAAATASKPSSITSVNATSPSSLIKSASVTTLTSPSPSPTPQSSLKGGGASSGRGGLEAGKEVEDLKDKKSNKEEDTKSLVDGRKLKSNTEERINAKVELGSQRTNLDINFNAHSDSPILRTSSCRQKTSKRLEIFDSKAEVPGIKAESTINNSVLVNAVAPLPSKKLLHYAVQDNIYAGHRGRIQPSARDLSLSHSVDVNKDGTAHLMDAPTSGF
ncbi:uncharacterized protein LOC143021303 [Oratosquilla oratoria]|uniref:uncharacterized protein LOC143021303 n=1 Tax=Oratosquilla oratoria TaxID=337810 RepID=UPI003F75BFAC